VRRKRVVHDSLSFRIEVAAVLRGRDVYLLNTVSFQRSMSEWNVLTSEPSSFFSYA
jgi:hypothetical protein